MAGICIDGGDKGDGGTTGVFGDVDVCSLSSRSSRTVDVLESLLRDRLFLRLADPGVAGLERSSVPLV
jgi:hypothetical protein